jgi:glycosyltransferase involved in cell wall biosynthesis
MNQSMTKPALAAGELRGLRVGVVVFSHYPSDPRPRRAAEALAEQGMQVEVICIKQSDDEAEFDTFNGVAIRRLSVKRRRGGKFRYVWQYAAFLTSAFFLLAGRTLKGRYDLVHVHNMPDILVFSALVPKVFGAKVILDLHDPMPELMMTIFGLKPQSFGTRLLEWLEGLSIRFADRVLTVNRACRNIFGRRHPNAEPVQVVMNAPDEKIFAMREPAAVDFAGAPGKPFVIMYHGSLVERHGLDLAVTALAKIRQTIPGAQLRIYGQTTPFLEKVLASETARQCAGSISYLGPKKLEAIALAIRESDIGVIPNRRSIFTEINTPTRIFEYLSQGKPVIAPRVPGIVDYFGPEDLVFFELGDADDLARQMEYAYQHRRELESITRRGQQVYNAHKWSDEREHFLQVVAELCGGERVSLKPATQPLAALKSSQ